MAKFKYNIDFEQKELTKALYNYSEKFKKSFPGIIKFGAIAFLQSATKLTPQSKKAQRDYDVKVQCFRRGELRYDDIFGHIDAPGDKYVSIIQTKNPIRVRRRSDSRMIRVGWWTIKVFWGVFSRSGRPRNPSAEVKRLREISYRGIGKSGWWKSLLMLGQSYAQPKNAAVLKQKQNAEVKSNLNIAFEPEIELINSTPKLQYYFNTGAIRGKAIHNARTRIMIMTREELRKRNREANQHVS